jgi:hypothetical protein
MEVKLHDFLTTTLDNITLWGMNPMGKNPRDTRLAVPYMDTPIAKRKIPALCKTESRNL